MVIIFFIKEIVILKKKIDKLIDRSATIQSSLEESEFLFLIFILPKVDNLF